MCTYETHIQRLKLITPTTSIPISQCPNRIRSTQQRSGTKNATPELLTGWIECSKSCILLFALYSNFTHSIVSFSPCTDINDCFIFLFCHQNLPFKLMKPSTWERGIGRANKKYFSTGFWNAKKKAPWNFFLGLSTSL